MCITSSNHHLEHFGPLAAIQLLTAFLFVLKSSRVSSFVDVLSLFFLSAPLQSPLDVKLIDPKYFYRPVILTSSTAARVFER